MYIKSSVFNYWGYLLGGFPVQLPRVIRVDGFRDFCAATFAPGNLCAATIIKNISITTAGPHFSRVVGCWKSSDIRIRYPNWKFWIRYLGKLLIPETELKISGYLDFFWFRIPCIANPSIYYWVCIK